MTNQKTIKYDPRVSDVLPGALPIKVDFMNHNENEIAQWLYEQCGTNWDLRFDEETSEMFIFLPTDKLSVLAKLTWG